MEQYILDSQWGRLPFPYEEMNSAKILLRVERVAPPYSACLHIDRDEGSDGRFSTVVFVTHLETGDPAVIGQELIRLSAVQQGAISRTSPPDPLHPYELSLPHTCFEPRQPRRQLRQGV